jgi:hypothetical protein
MVRRINLPKEIDIHWDRTLENKKIDINVSISDPMKWSGILTTLRSAELKDLMESILEEL